MRCGMRKATMRGNCASRFGGSGLLSSTAWSHLTIPHSKFPTLCGPLSGGVSTTRASERGVNHCPCGWKHS